jgi:hypothetical protein
MWAIDAPARAKISPFTYSWRIAELASTAN